MEEIKGEAKAKEVITKRDADFSTWYLDVVKAADLAENSPVRGSMVIKPYGYALWENIQKYLDSAFKKTGVQNAYFPLLIPLSFLEKEAEHVQGFAKECAVVTHHRLEEKDGKLVPEGELEEPFIIRPTSETIIYDAYARWIQSYRDLPLLINQWANVMRWEMRTRLFLRTSEFLWQEGHTAHATKEEAEAETMQMLHVYEDFLKNELAISAVAGRKTESEKFAGADYTTTLEALMQDGKALQSCTSHMLGQNFAKSFNVMFLDENQEKKYVWQTSWGLSTRIIGALIMSHSDDKGLVLPPRIAPTQVVVVPIYDNPKDRENVMTEVEALSAALEKEQVRYVVDDKDERPGVKFFRWERKGVPLRIEVGPKDVEKKSVVVVERIAGKKSVVPTAEIGTYVVKELARLQQQLFENNRKFREENTHEVSSYDEFKKSMETTQGFVLAPLCDDPSCEEKIKEETGASTRCIPFDQKETKGKCVFCGGEAHHNVLFAKAY